MDFKMQDDEFGISSLAQGLTGIAAEPPPCQLEGARAYAAAAMRPAPTASISPLILHLKQVVHAVIGAAARADHVEILDCENKLRSLTFALASTVGAARLETDDEGDLWQLTTALWVSRNGMLFTSQTWNYFPFGPSHKISPLLFFSYFSPM